MTTTGVGILGSGPVTQAIHLPTLARLRGAFHVERVMDVDPGVAASVAARVGASWTTSEDDLLHDERVEVVAVCSPHQFHARQVIAACRAGKKAVLCEKPFAMDRAEAEAIAAVSAETGVPILVGAMHTFDPGWLAARAAWGDLVEQAHTLRYDIVLPPNARFEDFATEVITRPAPPGGDRSDPGVAAAMMQGGIMGLAIHDLPLLRVFCPDSHDVEVLDALVVDPAGYLVDLRVGDRSVQLSAVFTAGWDPTWTVEAIGDDTALSIDFTPSYVHAGSARAVLRRGTDAQVFGPFDHNGYEGEWRCVADLVSGRARALDVGVLIDDLTFALDIAELASGAAAEGARRSRGASA